MKICRFEYKSVVSLGLVTSDSHLIDLAGAGIRSLEDVTEDPAAFEKLSHVARSGLPKLPLEAVRLRAPVDRQEVWAAGVTYLRSKAARMEESTFSATAYDRVYAAERPELFFKALPEKVVGPDDPVGIRRDAQWSVPEPELALVFNSGGKLVGCTIGNDMSSRDIEGENLLYLPQAKIYERSCALGPWIILGASEPEVRSWRVELKIEREQQPVFQGETSLDNIKRSFGQLAEYLFRSQQFPHGAILLTGTGIVPPDNFTLHPGDRVEIRVSGIGTLANNVVPV